MATFTLAQSNPSLPHTPTAVFGGKKKKSTAAQDDELDVFGAEKYFGVALGSDEVAAVESEKPRRLSPGREAKPASGKARPGTPSSCSEASCRSWSALLRDAQKGPVSPSSETPAAASAGGKKLFGVFRCSCSGKASVEVDKAAAEGGGRNAAGWRGAPRQVRPELWCSEQAKMEDCFALRSGFYPPAAGKMVVEGKVFDEKKAARVSSTAVYGAPFVGKEVGSGLRRSLTMMTAFAGSVGVAGDDDVCSESSSDLFEIDTISTGTLQFGATSGGTSVSTTCSAPSEASIEWSVVTASAANFSAASDGELSPPEVGEAVRARQHWSGGGLLLGCGGGKAVSITSNTHKLPEAVEAGEWPRHLRSLAVTPVIRYHPESPRSVEFKQGLAGHVSMARGIQRSASTHKPYGW